MKQPSLFLFLACMTLPPWGVQMASAQGQPTFDPVYKDLQNFPAFFAD